jgi:hypothetical protein
MVRLRTMRPVAVAVESGHIHKSRKGLANRCVVFHESLYGFGLRNAKLLYRREVRRNDKVQDEGRSIFDQFDFGFQPSIDEKQIASCAACASCTKPAT